MNLNEIINNNKTYIKNIIKLITHENNEDIEQEVYLKIWKNKNKYTECGKIKNWIATITKNLSKDYLKSSKYKADSTSASDENILISITDKKETPDEKFTNKLRRKRIINAINNLKPKLKEIIILYEIEGKSYDDISKKLKVPKGTVKSRLFNAKKQLAEELQDLL